MLLTFVEADTGSITESSAHALTVARGFADTLGVPVAAVAFASAGDISADLAKLGVARYHRVEHELLGDYAPECWAQALVGLLAELTPVGVLAAATETGNELLAHLAARASLPFAANCTELGVAGENWTLTRIRGGGVLLESAELVAPVKLVTVTAAAVAPSGGEPVEEVQATAFTPVFDTLPPHGKLLERTTETSGVSLATARVVVAGGRGVGSAEGFAALEELAALVGGAVGCSRVATNNGWRSHSDQVGLTGMKISPELYIACGISGATQHWVGCMDAKRILAINTDAEAPMVTRAAYAVIGDVHEVLPAVISEIRRRSGG